MVRTRLFLSSEHRGRVHFGFLCFMLPSEHRNSNSPPIRNALARRPCIVCIAARGGLKPLAIDG